MLKNIYLSQILTYDTQGRSKEFVQGGGHGSAPVWAWKPLKTKNFTGPGGGLAPRGPPPGLRLWWKMLFYPIFKEFKNKFMICISIN